MTGKALVTGGGGFLGRYIAEQLQQRGYQVTVFCRGHYPDLEQAGIRVQRGDVTNPIQLENAIAGQDLVFHVAAKVGYWGDYQDYYAVNVQGTDHVIRACRQQGVKKLIYTSSPSVTMNNIDIHGGDEQLPYPKHYHSHYSATKAIAERKVLAAHNPRGLHTVAIRPHLILGPRDNHLLPRILQKAHSGRLKQIGPGRNKVSVTYVENAAHAHILAAESPNTGGNAYFINEPDPILLWPWLKQILEKLDAPPPRYRVPFALAFAAGWVLENLYRALRVKQEPLVTRFIASELYRNHYFSIEKARRDFGYEPLYSFTQAEAKTLEYVRGEMGLGGE
ncbi:NAD-dependent epimerase/dehydratase family protein [Ketobacter sp.]|uniref:NAD-dependent epimerase/dehydratase family protein n=1 Tax=Ketobacter sp. TaxID=2083498 RepID=UPI000F1A4F5B|nr:NAD-dependent epimerase/dehydratase family protein [Ketobacter sp.]RLT96879.1 MAG: NAD-dependent epimerase/dehydratase family protein [Ketobacter sp.]